MNGYGSQNGDEAVQARKHSVKSVKYFSHWSTTYFTVSTSMNTADEQALCLPSQ